MLDRRSPPYQQALETIEHYRIPLGVGADVIFLEQVAQTITPLARAALRLVED